MGRCRWLFAVCGWTAAALSPCLTPSAGRCPGPGPLRTAAPSPALPGGPLPKETGGPRRASLEVAPSPPAPDPWHPYPLEWVPLVPRRLWGVLTAVTCLTQDQRCCGLMPWMVRFFLTCSSLGTHWPGTRGPSREREGQAPLPSWSRRWGLGAADDKYDQGGVTSRLMANSSREPLSPGRGRSRWRAAGTPTGDRRLCRFPPVPCPCPQGLVDTSGLSFPCCRMGSSAQSLSAALRPSVGM